ncbi:response regulator [Mucilaginibacter endophyticus]|uniref:response regulator n=1 Tax=Mucilaginibacter endophyticus TaxID=2675003 RepID=UPI000E0CE74D|nr:response regulator [Mucilaginibacter endophyticus]
MIPGIKNIKVLVVDDDNDILDVMYEALSYEGYEVHSLSEIDNIFHEIMSYKPDLIILDYILKGVTGGELCQQIKINRYTAQLPVIILSAYPKARQALDDCSCNIYP